MRRSLATACLIAGALFFVSARWSRGASDAVRTVKFSGGMTTIARETSRFGGDVERITVKYRDGKVSSSLCNVGDFDAYSALYARLKEAVTRDDRAAVVKLMAYPLHVYYASRGKKPVPALTFRKPDALLKVYDQAFTPHVLDVVRGLQPPDLFCRDGSVTSGGGTFWANYTGGDVPRIQIINR